MKWHAIGTLEGIKFRDGARDNFAGRKSSWLW